MKKCIALILWVHFVLGEFTENCVKGAIGTAFSYQGRLLDKGMPANGGVDLRFLLCSDPTNPDNVIASITKTNVFSTNGLFAVELDFGPLAFTGEPRWLDVAVRPAASPESFRSLGPRQSIDPVPYAIYANAAASALTAASVPWSGLTQLPPRFAGAGEGLAQSGTNISVAPGGIVNSMLGAGAVAAENLRDAAVTNPKLDNNSVTRAKIALGQAVKTINSLTDDIVLNSGENIQLTTAASGITVAATNVWRLSGNFGATPGQFLGTLDNQPLELRANNQRILRLEPNDTAPNLIGGANDNVALEGVFGGAIAGGRGNRVLDPYGSVGGGSGNQAGSDDGNFFVGRYTTVGGGRDNTAGGEESTVAGGRGNAANGEESTVGGGRANLASGYAGVIAGGGGYNATLGRLVPNQALGFWSAIGGGSDNTVTNEHGTIAGGENNRSAALCSTIGGGKNNAALANYATVPGGFFNSAEGTASLAAGSRAKAMNAGCFVWADVNSSDFSSMTDNEFAVRCTGGARFATSADGTASGVQLAAGGGSWSTLSDRNAKENFFPVTGADILEKVAALPVSTWNYKNQDPSIRHMGVTAQDFAAAFNVGEDDHHISTVDADGVTLAAIQGLHAVLRQKDTQLRAQQREIQELQARLSHLEKRFESLMNP